MRVHRSYVIVIIIAMSVFAGVVAKYFYDMDALKKEFQHLSRADAQAVGERYSQALATMYQGLRTIARLPGTRNIDRYAKNLKADTRHSIQEIYNNLYDNITLSEVYVVPVEFDPDVIDPNTGKPSEPIITFDEFIVGQVAEIDPDGELPVEEIEIYEYRLMKKQLQWMKENFPTEAHIKDLNYPAISGEEVVTCDNSMFSPLNPNDHDRSGLVYSVPFYGPGGNLRGIISGVILSNRLRAYLPNSNYVINNSTFNFMVSPRQPGPWTNSVELIRKNEADDSLGYSEVLKLNIIDAADWRLWVGISDNEFYDLPRVEAEQSYLAMALIALISITLTVLVVIRSYQEHKDTNRRLKRASKAKSEFLSRMSHELRTPLNAIIGYSELLIEQLMNQDIQQLEDCKKIKHAGKHLLKLVNDVLDVEKIESGQLSLNIETFYVDPMLQSLIATCKPLVARNNNTFEVSGVEKVGAVKADEMKLKQILLNILSNAAKFTRNGQISLDIKNETLDNKLWVVFTISDTGIGISPDNIRTIFEEFAQADSSITINYGGTGLGLTISKRFCELMGGNIKVESVVNSGSSFSVWIPSVKIADDQDRKSAVA